MATCFTSFYLSKRLPNLSCSRYNVPAYLSTCLPLYTSTCLPVYLPICLLVYLSTCLPVHLSSVYQYFYKYIYESTMMSYNDHFRAQSIKFSMQLRNHWTCLRKNALLFEKFPFLHSLLCISEMAELAFASN